MDSQFSTPQGKIRRIENYLKNNFYFPQVTVTLLSETDGDYVLYNVKPATEFGEKVSSALSTPERRWPHVLLHQRFDNAQKILSFLQHSLSHGESSNQNNFIEFSNKTVHYEVTNDQLEVFTIIYNSMTFSEFLVCQDLDDALVEKILLDITEALAELHDNRAFGYLSQDNVFIVNNGSTLSAKIGSYWMPRTTGTKRSDKEALSQIALSMSRSDGIYLQYLKERKQGKLVFTQGVGHETTETFDTQALPKSNQDNTIPQSHYNFFKKHFDAEKSFSLCDKKTLCSDRYYVASRPLDCGEDQRSSLFLFEKQSIFDVGWQCTRAGMTSADDFITQRVDHYCGPVLLTITRIVCIGTLGNVIEGKVEPGSMICGLKASDFLLLLIVKLTTSIAYLNDKGEVHGNLHPNNIFLIPQDGTLKVVLGYPWSKSTTNRHKTPAHLLQCIDHDPNAKCKEDVYAIGSILYDLLVGLEQHSDLQLCVSVYQKENTTKRLQELNFIGSLDSRNWGPSGDSDFQQSVMRNLDKSVKVDRFSVIARPFELPIAQFVTAAMQSSAHTRPTAAEALMSPLLLFHPTAEHCVRSIALRHHRVSSHFDSWLKAIVACLHYKISWWRGEQEARLEQRFQALGELDDNEFTENMVNFRRRICNTITTTESNMSRETSALEQLWRESFQRCNIEEHRAIESICTDQRLSIFLDQHFLDQTQHQSAHTNRTVSQNLAAATMFLSNEFAQRRWNSLVVSRYEKVKKPSVPVPFQRLSIIEIFLRLIWGCLTMLFLAQTAFTYCKRNFTRGTS